LIVLLRTGTRVHQEKTRGSQNCIDKTIQNTLIVVTLLFLRILTSHGTHYNLSVSILAVDQVTMTSMSLFLQMNRISLKGMIFGVVIGSVVTILGLIHWSYQDVQEENNDDGGNLDPSTVGSNIDRNDQNVLQELLTENKRLQKRVNMLHHDWNIIMSLIRSSNATRSSKLSLSKEET
jgi:hypothetical protein